MTDQGTNDIAGLLLLSQIPGVGPARLRSLVSHFGTPDCVMRASARDLLAVSGIDRKTALAILHFFRSADPGSHRRFVDDQMRRLARVDGHVLTYWDPEYPPLLKKIFDPPPFLFVRGTSSEEDADAIALVGTRSPSSYGGRMAERLTTGLIRRGLTVVSGLARGVDTIVHTVALKEGGRTIAVIGSGIDVPYPPENRSLLERITGSGAVISEFVMGAKPDAMNFPQRNRIISGMTLGTVIIETGVEGGAMITARAALEQNREVFAVPAAIQDGHRSGANKLIREGQALLIEDVDDILTELRPRLRPNRRDHATPASVHFADLTLFEQKLLDVFDGAPMHVDTIASRAGYAIPDALVHLLSLEFKGVVRQLPGKMFQRS